MAGRIAWRVHDLLREEGMRGVLIKAVKKALQPVIEVNRFVFFDTDLTRPRALLSARIPLEVRPASLADVDMYAKAFEEGRLNREEAKRRFESGHACLIALSAGELAHFQWVAFSATWIPEIGRTILLGPGEAYAYDAVTLARWRGYGVHPAVSSFSDQYKRSLGLTRHFSYVRADNRRSLKGRAKLARRPTKTIWSVRILGMKRPLVFGAAAAGRPVLVSGQSERAPWAHGREQ